MKPSEEQINQLKQSLIMFRMVVIAFVAVVLSGTIFFHLVEKWRWLDSIYFVIVTMSTVGYGNIVPETDSGKVGNMVLIILGIGIFGVFINQFLKYQALRRLERKNGKKSV